MATIPTENLEAAFRDGIISIEMGKKALTKRQKLYYHHSVVFALNMLHLLHKAGAVGLDYEQLRIKLTVALETAKQYAAWLKSHELVTIEREKIGGDFRSVSIVRVVEKKKKGKQLKGTHKKELDDVKSGNHLFINSQSSVEASDSCLLVNKSNYYDFTEINGVFVFGDVHIDRQTTMGFLKHRIPVAFFDEQGNFIGRLEPLGEKSLSFAQDELLPERRLELCHCWVHTALEQRRRLLQRKARDGSSVNSFEEDFEPILKRFDRRWPKQHPTSPGEVLGLYGAGMNVYWQHFPSICHYFDFDQGRKGSSLLNQMIEFAYNLIEQYLLNLLLANAFNPAVGLLHRDIHQRYTPPLARDVAIEFKVIGEQIIVGLINRRQILLKDFNSTVLSERVCTIIKGEFLRRIKLTITHPTGVKCTYQEAFQLQVNSLKKFYASSAEIYTPLLLK